MFISVMVVATSLLAVFSLTIGQFKMPFLRAFEVLFDCMVGNDVPEIERYVVWDLKVPRAIMGVLVGSGLAVSGACMQGMLRNPLADPFTTGVSSGASFGATLMILYGMCLVPGLSYRSSIVVNAFILSLVPMAAILLISRFKKVSPDMAILIGISVMFIFSSTTSLMKLLADPNDLAEAYSWGVGTLGKATWDNIGIVAVFTIVSIALIFAVSGRIGVLSMGDRQATTLGVDPWKGRVLVLGVVSLMTAASVSFTGPIGFVGLIAPHVCRMLLGSDMRLLLPASAAMGALVMLLADCISQGISAVYLPVGSVTALFGGPFFLYILLRSNGRSWSRR